MNSNGRCLFKKELSRKKLIECIANLPVCPIAMEACGGAHDFARKFQQFGHKVQLLAPQFVKPYVKGNKNDSADAAAICEAASRDHMNFVSIKTVSQQDVQSIHQRLIKHKTALMNEIRGLLFE